MMRYMFDDHMCVGDETMVTIRLWCDDLGHDDDVAKIMMMRSVQKVWTQRGPK